MFGTGNNRKLGIIAKTALVFFAFLMLVAPAFGQVKKATSRVLYEPDDIVTTRKGNFNIGDILGTALVSITVVNNNVPAYLLLKLRIDFGGAWDEHFVQAGLVKALGSNETFTFTNRDIINSIVNIRTTSDDDGFSMSDGLQAATGVNGIEDITSLQNIPEGTYSITLSASEITLETPSNINSAILTRQALKSEQVDFKVVTIGSIGNIDLPSVDDLSLTFQVPEIPVYDDLKGISTSSTKVDISGPGVTYSSGKNHLKSTTGSSAIKGYPSDTTNGYVTYDLASVPFRAGETYSINIAFNDWNNPPATITSKTTSVKFPTPALNLSANVTEPFRPVFSWSFSGTDYSDWVKEYRVYLNGRYIGMTSDDTYQVADRLTPNTAYTWYVMPINRDGTNFFASTSGLIQSLTTKTHTVLNVAIDGPVNNALLLKGESYNFSGTATFSDGAAESAAVWTFGTETKTGMDVSFTPARRYAANSLAVNLKVTDSLGLSKTTPNINLTVLDPAVAISGNATRTINKNGQITFTLDGANTRDMNSYEWFVDGSSIGTGSQKTHTFADTGNHVVHVVGTSLADISGTSKSLQSTSVTVTVQGAGPVVTLTQPASGGELVLGNSVRFVAAVESENGLKSSVWTVVGPDTSQSGATGSNLVFTPRTAGEYTLTLTVLDSYDKQGSVTARLLVIDPSIAITSPAPNAVFSLTSILTPTISAPNADRIVWFLGGEEISTSSFALSENGTGNFTLYAVAYWNAIDSNGSPMEYSEASAKVTITVRDMSPPVIAIGFPRNDMVFKTGETYTFAADTTAASAISDSWWEVQGTRLSSNTYTIPANTTLKLLRITYNAVNSDGIRGVSTVSVRVVNPAVFLSAPASTEYQLGAVVPISASVIDADLSWIVDGLEQGSWDKIFTSVGSHTVRALWKVEAVAGNGNEREFTGQSNAVTLSIYSNEPPVISSFTPSATLVREKILTLLEFQVRPTTTNPLQSISWRIMNGSTLMSESTGNAVAYTFGATGQYTVTALVRDNHGLTASKEWTVKIINPSLAITSPATGTVFALNAVSTPVVSAQDLVSFHLVLDGNNVAQDFNWNSVAQGSHNLRASGLYAVSSQALPLSILSTPITFTVENRTPPSFTIEGVRDGDRIIAGKQYTFVARKTGNESITWLKNGASIASGSLPEALTFVPSAAERDVTFTAVGRLNNITVEKTFTVRVVDPFISILIPTNLYINNLLPSLTPIPLQAQTRDIDRIAWTVDFQNYTSPTVSFTPGNHSISVKGFATGVRLPDASYGDYEAVGAGTTGRDVVVADRITVDRIVAQPAALLVGETVIADVTLGGSRIDDLLRSVTYYLNGIVQSQGRLMRASFSNLPAGRHTLKATALDVFGNSSSAETAVTVYQPLIVGIAQPARDAKFSPDANVLVSAAISSGQYSNISWSVDGATLPNSNFTSISLGRLSSGRHTITVNVTDLLFRVVSSSVNVEVQSDFQLSLLAPASGTVSIIGNELTCMVGVERFAGSDFNLSDAAQNISWYVNGSNTGSKGLTYKFTGTSAGDQVIQARYEKDGMVRTTAERTVTVRDIAVPVIRQPVNGATISYSQGAAISLSATGEPGATFTWDIDGIVVAVGAEATYNPNGLSGQKQLKLSTSAFGRAKEKLVTITLAVNNPPTLALAAPAVQFTGDALTWTATAFDVEDQNALQVIEAYLDGVRLASGVSKILRTEDIGQHTLSARTTDSAGVSVTRQVPVRVESNQLLIEVQSPQAGATFYSGYDVRLMASLAAGSVDSTVVGSFNWVVQYLDDPNAQPGTLTGSSTVLQPRGLGEVAISVKYLDGNGRERGSSTRNVRVEREALNLGIYWPHGSVVNAGDPLSPSVTGLPANGATGTVTWSLNGAAISSLATLRAPVSPGQYKLSVQYVENGSADRAEIDFAVNAKPVVTIMNLVAQGQYVAGNPLVLSARIDDDQTYSGTVVWKNQGGTILGEGNPFVFSDSFPGESQITATATDKYGASAEASIPLRFYLPISAISVTVNNGQTTYLLAEGNAPLEARVEFADGITPEATWTLKQSDLSVVKTGTEAAYSYSELASFVEGPAMVSLALTDNGLANEAARSIFRQDFPVTLARNAIAELVSPAAGDPFWVGSPIPITLSLTGFRAPSFLLTMNGVPVTEAWRSVDGAQLYGTEVPASLVRAEGVYELSITVSENRTSRTVPFTLNVYTQRRGIFVDNPPAQIDLEAGVGTVEAVVSGLANIDGIQWRTDLSSEPVGTGTILNLAAIGLLPGNRSITAEALSAGRIVSSQTFLTSVLGPMNLTVTPEEELLIIERGAAVTMEASAKDRDGAILTDAAISWSSHLDGVLGTGTSLALGSLGELSEGDHIISVIAVGASGSSLTTLKRIHVNVSSQRDNNENRQSNNDNNNSGSGNNNQQGTGPAPGGFGPGAPLAPLPPDGPLGPGGNPANPQFMNFLINAAGGGGLFGGLGGAAGGRGLGGGAGGLGGGFGR